MTAMSRREALVAGLALLAGGCGAGASTGGRRGRAGATAGQRGSLTGVGSTLRSTWADPHGTGTLTRAPGEPLLARTELGPARPAAGLLATLGHLTDAHVLDASSPARVPFLDRLGAPFQSTFRPQETLTAQVLAGAVRSLRALAPDALLQGGDLIDNDQANELARALGALRGGTVDPGRYYGVQIASDADPFYYRPDLDAPRHPGLLAQASRRFTSPGLGTPWYPVLGDHDILVAGEIAPDAATRALAVGGQALWEMPPGLSLPPGVSLTTNGSPDGPPLPGLVNGFLAQALAGPKVAVPADPTRRELGAEEVVARLRRASVAAVGRGPGAIGGMAGIGAIAGTLDYTVDIGHHVRVIVLDLARRAGGSGGLVRPDQPGWLASQLAGRAGGGERGAQPWIIVASHQPLETSEGGESLLALLDAHPPVLAAISGHTHHNRIAARPTAAGGYWLIQTASLIDYPQQARALRVLATKGGGAALQTWMIDHEQPGDLGQISRQLAYLDAQGGRPGGFAGTHADRNVVLYRAPPVR